MDRMDDEKDSRGKDSVCLSKICSREMHKKRATLACHSECLHNGIILIVYIIKFSWCKGTAFFEITKYFQLNLHISFVFCNLAAKLELLC